MFIIPAPEPIAFNICNIPIYKYGVVMALAIFVSILTANKLYGYINEFSKKDIILEYAPVIIIFGILCARIYFCMLNPHFYLTHPVEIFDIRQGGLSIHGAIIGGILSVIYIAKRTQKTFWTLMDAISASTFIGQAIGRWGNYFNSEAYGLPVSGQHWGLFIPQNLRPINYADTSLFHPAFLYESGLDLLGFLVMLFIYCKFGKKYKGLTFFVYLILYAVIRFFIEQIRIDSALNLGVVPIAQVVSVVLFIIGLVGVVLVSKNVKSY